MSYPSYIWISGLWERINGEIRKQNRSKLDVATHCGFDRKTLYGNHNISLQNLAKLCKELNVSADYLLLGKNDCVLERMGSND